MSFSQPPMEQPCLRYPDNLGLHANVTLESAVSMLLRAIQFSQTMPYSWGFIDKPQEGQMLLLYLPNPNSFPNDGIRYQDQETRYSVPAGQNRELEVMEIKHGFIPGSQDNSAWRLRRRYRLSKGGHPQLTIVHYTRGPFIPIVPSLQNAQVRQYPLRPINDPPVFVMGDKAGQKVFPPGAGPGPQGMPTGAPSGPMPPIAMNQQAMLAQQNSNMEALERRRERERGGRDRSGSMPGQRPGPPRLDDDESADESELISTRTLALTRYRRNHELMEEVFKEAAFGKKKIPPPPSPYSMFDQAEIEAKLAKLQSEVEELEAKASQRKADKENPRDVFVSGVAMDVTVS
ncbi:hypothetical protein BJ138DRAFT_1081741 [Hygrophoropsis aurantiaca]|uniref:Uncharacterized protein n=1 Tax=Hygrophoropsis aurantiaca TaxID=72124 RepID=A0ACB8AJF3_9AGAM|nr:hypothetical protein BJ138DRAFT_1081741 [Hygrophoropsis aurantiaca]